MPASSLQPAGLPGAPLGKRPIACTGLPGKPQKVMSASLNGTAWVIPETVKRSP